MRAERLVPIAVAMLLVGIKASSGEATAAAVGHPLDSNRCAQFAGARVNWPDPSARLLNATWRSQGWETSASIGPPLRLPEHCEISGLMQERVGVEGQHYAIRFRMRLPAHWNGRFFFEGGGGSEGEVGPAIGLASPGSPTALDRGYAVASQDSGHDNATNSIPERGGLVAFGFDPQARANYGGLAPQLVAGAAKAIIHSYYGRDPERSYFVGCSKGGQEGMAFAQRYPDVFDGIVAGAPGFALPRAALAEAWDTQAFGSLVSTPESTSFDPQLLPTSFSAPQFALVRKAILDACDADDGVRDGITAAFGSCTWRRVAAELRRKICSPSPDGACITEAQLAVLGRVLGGPKNNAGEALYSDWPVDAGIGSEGWRVWKIGPSDKSFPGINVTMGSPALAAIFTTPPTALAAGPRAGLDFALGFDFDRDAPRIYATTAVFRHSAWTDISARSADLERFRAHRGKMIVPHGASDPVFSLNDTLAWYREVDQLNHGNAADFVRVFPVPGMAHCRGGPATDQFDAFDALVDWVEHGKAPERIIAHAGNDTPWPGRTRPLCAYPKVARYAGSGSIEDAANFQCN